MVVAQRLDEIARRLESAPPDAAENRADAVERRLADLAEQLRRLTSLLAG
jgi:predicted transcriptional regulator